MVSNDQITLILFKAFQLILPVQLHLKIIFSFVQRKKTKHMKTQYMLEQKLKLIYKKYIT